MKNTDLIPSEKIEKTIYLIRGEKVMLDRDLAKLYGVLTGALNQAVRRNHERFPEDFMFQLTTEEVRQLNLSQIVTGSEKHRDRRFRSGDLPTRTLRCFRFPRRPIRTSSIFQ